MDFGVARSETAPRVTADGAIVGTPEYMSPEQASGEKATALCDIYALGIVLYELLTGTVPFEADTPLRVIKKIQTEEPPPPRSINPRIPVRLERIVLKMIAKDPAKRYQSCREILEDLGQFRAGGYVSTPTARLSNITFSIQTTGILLTVFFVILILGGITYLTKGPPENVGPAGIPPQDNHANPPEPNKPTKKPSPKTIVRQSSGSISSAPEKEPEVIKKSMSAEPAQLPRSSEATPIIEPPATETQEIARRKLQEMEIPYTADEFIERVAQDDANAASLFLAGGMNPDTMDEYNRTALILSAINNSITTLKILLDNNTEINAEDAEGLTAVMHGARLGYSGIVDALLAKGASVDSTDRSGMTALLLAAQGGFPEIVEALLEHGADGNAKNTGGKTALLISAGKGYAGIVKMLLAAGADANTKDASGMTALMLATQAGSPEAVQVLLENRADLEAQDAFGRTALAWAELRDQEEIARLLKEAGPQE